MLSTCCISKRRAPLAPADRHWSLASVKCVFQNLSASAPKRFAHPSNTKHFERFFNQPHKHLLCFCPAFIYLSKLSKLTTLFCYQLQMHSVLWIKTSAPKAQFSIDFLNFKIFSEVVCVLTFDCHRRYLQPLSHASKSKINLNLIRFDPFVRRYLNIIEMLCLSKAADTKRQLIIKPTFVTRNIRNTVFDFRRSFIFHVCETRPKCLDVFCWIFMASQFAPLFIWFLRMEFHKEASSVFFIELFFTLFLVTFSLLFLSASFLWLHTFETWYLVDKICINFLVWKFAFSTTTSWPALLEFVLLLEIRFLE